MKVVVVVSALASWSAPARGDAGPPLPGVPDPTPRDPYADQHGFTFEANLGLAFGLGITMGQASTTGATLGGPSLGIGGWIAPRFALTARITGIAYHDSDTLVVLDEFIGPSLQYWIDPHAWVGGGLGLAWISDCGPGCDNGFGGDLRAGYSIGDGPSRFDISVEVTPADYHLGFAMGFALLFGYQHL